MSPPFETLYEGKFGAAVWVTFDVLLKAGITRGRLDRWLIDGALECATGENGRMIYDYARALDLYEEVLAQDAARLLGNYEAHGIELEKAGVLRTGFRASRALRGKK